MPSRPLKTYLPYVFSQHGKLKPKDLKEAIRQARADQYRQKLEQETLRAITASLEEGEDEEGTIPPENFGRNNEDGVENDGSAHAETAEVVHRDIRAGEAAAPGVRGGGVGVCGDRRRGQPAQLGEKAICAFERMLFKGAGGGTGPGAGTKQLKEMSFLEDLAAGEAEERDRAFKASCRKRFPDEIWRTVR